MKIQINEDWRITTDAYNYILEQRRVLGEKSKTPGEERWIEKGFWPTLEQALTGFVERSLRESDAECLKEVLDHLTRLHRLIEGLKQ